LRSLSCTESFGYCRSGTLSTVMSHLQILPQMCTYPITFYFLKPRVCIWVQCCKRMNRYPKDTLIAMQGKNIMRKLGSQDPWNHVGGDTVQRHPEREHCPVLSVNCGASTASATLSRPRCVRTSQVQVQTESGSFVFLKVLVENRLKMGLCLGEK
jgi:hypothetical protein